MRQRIRWVPILAFALAAGHAAEARAQWGYPGGFGMCGWGGWGVDTPEGSLARGMGAYAAGAGFYNKATAVADSINADTSCASMNTSTSRTRRPTAATRRELPAKALEPTPSSTRSRPGSATTPNNATSSRVTPQCRCRRNRQPQGLWPKPGGLEGQGRQRRRSAIFPSGTPPARSR